MQDRQLTILTNRTAAIGMYSVLIHKYLSRLITNWSVENMTPDMTLYEMLLDVIVSPNQRLPGACNRSPGSKLLSITTQLHCGGHLGGRVQLPDTILEEDHPMTIPSKFGFN